MNLSLSRVGIIPMDNMTTTNNCQPPTNNNHYRIQKHAIPLMIVASFHCDKSTNRIGQLLNLAPLASSISYMFAIVQCPWL